MAWEELSHKDVSIVLGCTENAVAIRLHRARTRLVKVLQTEKKFSEVEGLGDLIERFSPETTGTS